ncbi:PAS domain-containing protein [Hasllibacter halocynthiae]|nr:PAS domain-containing protein [Hasllibacter halocynthiae]
MADDFPSFAAADFPDGIALSALTRAPFSLVITDSWQDDNPIVYVNRAFTDVTGYGDNSALGRNCRFLQGDLTSREAVQRLRDAIAGGDNVTVELVNYRADGSPFRNRLMIAPLVSEGAEQEDEGEPRYFLGVQMARRMEEETAEGRADTLDRALSEVQHRVKNHLAMIVGMIRLQARQDGADGKPAGGYDALSRRIEALQLLYAEITEASAADGPVPLGAYLSRMGAAIAKIDGRPGVRFDIETLHVEAPFQTATHLGLLISEVLTNAFQHAFEGRSQGRVALRMEQREGRLCIVVSDDGNGLGEDVEWPQQGSLGSRIVHGLQADLGAELTVDTGDGGTTVTLLLPEDAP